MKRRTINFIRNIAKGYLFSISPNFKTDLRNNKISEDLKMVFKGNEYPLSSNIKISTIDNNEWRIRDGGKEYIIRESGNQLNIYEERSNLLVNLYIYFNLLKQAPFRDFINIKKLRLFLKVRPYTMLSYSGLSNAYELATITERYKIEGCFVECGVWRGGSAAVMAYVAHNAGSNRKIHLFDSFEGLPEPSEEDGNEEKLYAENKAGGRLSSIGKCVGPYDDLIYLFFSLLKLKKENVVIHKGWFQDTIPKIKNTIGPIAILRLDADWYESTKICLDNLYDNVVSGGFIIIDDYGSWKGCKKAVDEFLANRKIRDKIKMIKINPWAIYFQIQKP